MPQPRAKRQVDPEKNLLSTCGLFPMFRRNCTQSGARGISFLPLQAMHKNNKLLNTNTGGTEMKFNKWTLALAAGGVLSLGSIAQAEEAAQNQVMTALSSTTLSGYVSTSAIWKLGTGNANLPGRSYDGPSKQDNFNLDVVKLTLEKPLDEGQWSAGYRTDLLFGPDANVFNTTSAPPFRADQDFAIKQAYVALRAPVGNGIDIKLGVWDTIIGYEVFDAGSNPNYSRSYGYFLEPTTYTGRIGRASCRERV